MCMTTSTVSVQPLTVDVRGITLRSKRRSVRCVLSPSLPMKTARSRQDRSPAAAEDGGVGDRRHDGRRRHGGGRGHRRRRRRGRRRGRRTAAGARRQTSFGASRSRLGRIGDTAIVLIRQPGRPRAVTGAVDADERATRRAAERREAEAHRVEAALTRAQQRRRRKRRRAIGQRGVGLVQAYRNVGRQLSSQAPSKSHDGSPSVHSATRAETSRASTSNSR